jgi:hypothetical protein
MNRKYYHPQQTSRDLKQPVPNVRNTPHPPAAYQKGHTRSDDLLTALAGTPNKFLLCAQLLRTSGVLHRPGGLLSSVAISRAVRRLVDPPKARAAAKAGKSTSKAAA